MRYYRYNQNNTGGRFAEPAFEVFIEANNPNEADEVAVKHGIYFDPFYAFDCECCGSRWDNASDWDAYDELPPEDSNHWFDDELRDGLVRRLVIKGDK